MYRVFLLLTLVGALAEEPCTCDQVTNDIEDLRRFLANPEKYNHINILPGELSPYVCTCNKYRQRRSEALQRIHHPKVVADAPSTPKPFDHVSRKKCAKRSQELGRNRCASGYIRKGMFCIKDPCHISY